MNNLTPQLNDQQIRENINALRRGGLPTEKIQAYVDNYRRSSDGNYVLKNQPAPQETPQPFSGFPELTTLYGGGEQGIAQKLYRDIQAGAKDISAGNTLKGITKAGLRTALDFAGTVYAPIAAPIGATGIGKLTDKIGQSISDSRLGNAITDMPEVQDFAIRHPNAAEDFGRILNLLLAYGERGTIEPSTAIPRTIEQIKAIPSGINAIRPTAESIAQERQAKLNKGFEEQNVRLKSVNNAYNENVIVRTDAEGNHTTITPIDTFAKYGIAPVVEKGSIQMGDYRTGTGELGKIKTEVTNLDNLIDTKLVNTGQKIDTLQLWDEARTMAKNNPEFKREGSVESNVNKINARFNDYINSYGDTIDIAELNNIRKVANKDWNPETQDTSSIIGDVARDRVYNATPDKEIQGLLQQQGELLVAKKYAQKINGTKVVGGRLGNLALRTTGAIIGSTIPKLPIVGPIIGVIGGEYAARALQQTQFKSAWTELKALLQSNSQEATTNANKIPNRISIANQIEAFPTIRPKIEKYVKNPKIGLSLEDVSKNLTTKFLDYAKGKDKLSKQEIIDFARRPELKKGEADLLLKKLKELEPIGMKIYRGVEKGITNFQPSSAGRFSKSGSFSVTTDPIIAKNYGEYGSTIEGYLNPNTKIKTLGNDIANTKTNPEKEIEKAKLQGYDAIKASFMGEEELIILNKDTIQQFPRISAQEFADSIRRDLLELKPVKVKNPNYFNTTITRGNYNPINPDDISRRNAPDKMGSKNYEEVVFESPITTNGSSHYPNSKNYFAHARGDEVVEGGKKVWREQEIQSDLLQKGGLDMTISDVQNVKVNGKELTVTRNRYVEGTAEKQQRSFLDFKPNQEQSKFYGKENNFWSGNGVSVESNKGGGDITLDEANQAVKEAQKLMDLQVSQIETKLSPFTNDRFGERIMRERIKQKAQQGYSSYRIPTGETIGKIEGFEIGNWATLPEGGGFGARLKPEDLKVGMPVQHNNDTEWIITDILGNGRFKAVSKENYEGIKNTVAEDRIKSVLDRESETFDLTSKSNPQYIRYEKWGKFLKNKYGGREVTDPQRNTWVEIDLKPEYKRMPIEAFGLVPFLGHKKEEK